MRIYVCRLFFLLLFIVGALGAAVVDASSPQIYVLRVDGTIVPVVADYLDQGITEAEERGASAVVIELNTPGGVLNSTQQIVERIMNAEIPVIVYVSPMGARAASAGVFITLSAHVAAMAGGTSMGAAHPVALGSSGEEMPEVMEQKVTEYSVSWVRSIAEERGRNVDWAELAVRESASLSDRRALELNVIDLRAPDLGSLLEQVDGMAVQVGADKVVLNTMGYQIREHDMSLIQRFLHAISEPNIAYILMSIGSLGLILELYSPGTIIPGVVGAICLLMAFYSLSVLNAYWAGIILIALAFGLFAAEVFTTSFGILTAGGLASMVAGSLILFSGGPAMFGLQVDWWLIVLVTLAILAFFVFVIQAVVRTQRQKQPTGQEGLVGMVAQVRSTLNPRGTVFVHGELWEAILGEGKADPGEEVTVTAVEGLKLHVTKKGK